ncbi:Golgin sub A member 7, partial [Lobosporangium transversale]
MNTALPSQWQPPSEPQPSKDSSFSTSIPLSMLHINNNENNRNTNSNRSSTESPITASSYQGRTIIISAATAEAEGEVEAGSRSRSRSGTGTGTGSGTGSTTTGIMNQSIKTKELPSLPKNITTQQPKYQPRLPSPLSPGGAQNHSTETEANNSHQQQQQQQQHQSADYQRLSEPPTGIPRCIVRVDRDHNLADQATRFDNEQFPEEFVGRISIQQFKKTVEGINECMRDAEQSMLNCLDTLLDCLTAYTAKHCFGTHYQRAIRRMEEFIEQENRQIYHPARMHLRDPQKVGMIY